MHLFYFYISHLQYVKGQLSGIPGSSSSSSSTATNILSINPVSTIYICICRRKERGKKVRHLALLNLNWKTVSAAKKRLTSGSRRDLIMLLRTARSLIDMLQRIAAFLTLTCITGMHVFRRGSIGRRSRAAQAHTVN